MLGFSQVSVSIHELSLQPRFSAVLSRLSWSAPLQGALSCQEDDSRSSSCVWGNREEQKPACVYVVAPQAAQQGADMQPLPNCCQLFRHY